MFTTPEANLPEMPDLTSPLQLEEDVQYTPVLQWTSTGSDYYNIRLWENVSGNQLFIESAETNSYMLIQPLTENTNYLWQVKAVKDGIEGAWGPHWEFSTGIYENETNVHTPLLVAPDRGEEFSSLKPTFEWGNVEADHYILTVLKTDTVQAKSNALLQMQSSVIYAEIPENVYAPGEDLDPATVYYWKVKGLKMVWKGSGASSGNLRPQRSTSSCLFIRLRIRN